MRNRFDVVCYNRFRLLFFCVVTLIFSSPSFSQCTSPSIINFSFTTIPFSDPDLNAPFRGVEQWHDQNSVNVPVQGTNTPRLDKYYRFNWSQIQLDNGTYDFTVFDTEINDAIDNGQRFSFGIMPTCSNSSTPGVNTVSGSLISYPLFLHTQMQGEANPDWVSPISNMWIPNWNSNYYLTALENLYTAINNHLESTIYSGVRYKDVIGYIDVRGYGNYGEWHEAEIVTQMSDHPTGTRASVTTLKRIIDAHVTKLLNYPLVIMISAFDGNRLLNTQNDPEVGYYALTVQNNFGKLGWRRDNWGALDNYISDYLENNTTTYSGLLFSTAIMDRWKTSPIVGEPIQTGPVYNSCAYGAMEDQVTLYHATSFGNGNYSSTSASCMRDHIRAASKATGYRLVLEGGAVTSNFLSGTPFTINLNWKNVGITPVYEIWDVVYELRDETTNTLIWSGYSTFNPKLFLPQVSATSITDKFTLPSTITTGDYKLNVIIKDPKGYRAPLPLAIEGRNPDGSYTLDVISLTQNSSTTTASLNGTVILEGRPATPNAQWIVPLNIKLYVTGNPTPVAEYYNVMTDQNGNFTIHCLPTGTYNIAIKSPNTLQRVNTGKTLIVGSNSISIDTLYSGDANNNNVVSATDFSIFLNSQDRKYGDLKFDKRADFNGDGYVNQSDLDLMMLHYNVFGETP